MIAGLRFIYTVYSYHIVVAVPLWNPQKSQKRVQLNKDCIQGLTVDAKSVVYVVYGALAIWSASRDHAPAHYKRDGTTCAGLPLLAPAEFTSSIRPFDTFGTERTGTWKEEDVTSDP